MIAFILLFCTFYFQISTLIQQHVQSNYSIHLNSIDRTRLNNITNCYDQYIVEPNSLNYSPPSTLVYLRLHEFFNRKKPIFINFTSYFKQLPEFKNLNVDDRVLLIKQNIRLLIPLNYAILKTPIYSKFRQTYIQTIDCLNNVNLHTMFMVTLLITNLQ